MYSGVARSSYRQHSHDNITKMSLCDWATITLCEVINSLILHTAYCIHQFASLITEWVCITYALTRKTTSSVLKEIWPMFKIRGLDLSLASSIKYFLYLYLLHVYRAVSHLALRSQTMLTGFILSNFIS